MKESLRKWFVAWLVGLTIGCYTHLWPRAFGIGSLCPSFTFRVYRSSRCLASCG
jgi:hypothetical protein